MTRLVQAAILATLIALLVVLCTTKQVVLVTQAEAAAPISAPAPAAQSGVLYVANHGAWG